MESLPSAREIALSTIGVSHVLAWLFVPYMVLVTAAVFLLKGRNAGEVRVRIAVFTGGLVIGMLLCTMWLLTGVQFCRYPPLAGAPGPAHSRGALLLTGPMLWRIIPLFSAVSVHSLIHIAAGLRAAPRCWRNKAASLFIAVAVGLAACSITPQVRFWKRLYSREAMAASREALSRMAASTDDRTRRWANDHPADWGALLLRANFLYESGRDVEARAVDKTMLQLPGDSLPEGLRSWIDRRLAD